MNFIKKNKNVLLGISALILFVVLGEAAIASKPKTLELVVDNIPSTIETTTKTVEDTLLENGFSIEDVKVEEELGRNVTDNLTINVHTKKNIKFKNQGTDLSVTTFASSVEDLLKENNITFDNDDIVSPSLDTNLSNGDTVTYDLIEIVNYEKNVEVKFETKNLPTFELKFGENKTKTEGKNGLELQKFTKISKNGKVESDELVEKTEIEKVIHKEVLVGTKEEVEENVPFKTVNKNNSNMYKGESKVIQDGENGLAKRIYKNENGKRELVEETILKPAKDKILEVGTKERPAAQNQSPTSSQYSLSQFQFHGVIRWGGKKFTYYSQSVLPGTGLRIPGRHVNSGGYVADADGYIVLASNASIPKGTIFNTPFGYQGKVYDTCASCTIEWLDVYTK